jgi:D-glycero-D-manno-heptose 1,7-bisphosphate phosphatase
MGKHCRCAGTLNVPAISYSHPLSAIVVPTSLRPAVFLDRDGTLNLPVIRDGKPYPPATVEEFVLFNDAIDGCARLHAAGFVLVLATNQPDVGRGTQSRETVEAIHARLRQLVPTLDHIEVSYDSGRESPPSLLRKPAPGMLLRAAAELRLDLTRSWMIGDRWRDVDCGRNAGVHTVFIDRDYHESLRTKPDFIARTFAAAVGIILAQHEPG